MRRDEKFFCGARNGYLDLEHGTYSTLTPADSEAQWLQLIQPPIKLLSRVSFLSSIPSKLIILHLTRTDTLALDP